MIHAYDVEMIFGLVFYTIGFCIVVYYLWVESGNVWWKNVLWTLALILFVIFSIGFIVIIAKS